MPSHATIGDLGVLVLEREERPLKAYDIVRSIRREFDLEVSESSLNVYLSKDRRFCWGGKGIYGLYRHRLFPGPRSIGDAALLFLYASREAMKPEVLAYVMKSEGYRFQNLSLTQSLGRHPEIAWTTFGQCTIRSARSAERHLEDIDVAPTPASFQDVINRCHDFTTKALSRYHRKLSTKDLDTYA